MTLSNLQLRILSALVLAPVVLGAVWYGELAYGILIVAMVGIGLGEWHAMTQKPLAHRAAFRFLGALYVGGGGVSLLYLRGIQDHSAQEGLAMLLYLLLVVWATDTGAYFAGTLIGGPKILPRISPKKTWAGLIGGMIAAAVVGACVVSFYVNEGSEQGGNLLLKVSLLAALTAVIAQAGDFFESFIKRRAGVKDSGSLIPGHGGVLDRVDGLLTAAIFLALCRLAGLSLFT